MKLAFTCWPKALSFRDLALGDRRSQAWKPDRDTPIASHSHATMKMLSPEVNIRLIAPKRRNVGNPWFKRGTLPCHRRYAAEGHRVDDGGRYL